MTFTPFVFLGIYLAGVGIFLLLAVLNIYHAIRFGSLRATTVVTTFSFLIISVGVIVFTFYQLRQIQWDEPLTITVPFIQSSEQTDVPAE